MWRRRSAGRGTVGVRRLVVACAVLALSAPGLGAQAGAGSGSPQAVIHSVGQTAWEPTLGFTESGALFFLAMGSDTSNQLRPSAVMRSRDLGDTWEDVSPAHVVSGDPYLYVDPTTSRIFVTDFVPASCSQISFSDDEGETWTTAAGGCALQDHQTLFAGPPVFSKPSGYPNVVYYCAATANVRIHASASGCQKSLDGGLTWLPGGIAFFGDPTADDGSYRVPGACDAYTGHGFAGHDGTIYLPKGQCGQPWIGISRDEGLTWERIQVASNGMAYGDGGALDYPWMGWYTHEAGVQADDEGNLYYTWVARDLLAYLAVSRDRGRTWGEPIRISPPDVREASLPNIVVGDPGRLAVAYIASTNAPGPSRPEFPDCLIGGGIDCESTATRYENVTWNGYITMTVNALQPNPKFLTAVAGTPDDPLEKGPCGQNRCGNLGDFFDVVIGPGGAPWAAFVDDCVPAACPADSIQQGIGIAVEVVGGPSLTPGSAGPGR